MKSNAPRPAWTLTATAAALGVSAKTAERWARLGKIATLRVGRTVRVPAGEVDRLLKGNQR